MSSAVAAKLVHGGLGEAVASVLGRSRAYGVLARLPLWRGVLTLGYHRIGDATDVRGDADLLSATQEQFERQVRFLARHFDLVAAADLPAALDARRGRHIVVTFDDGYRDNHRLAYPVLRAHGVPAIFFLATGYLDRPRLPWWDEIARMLQDAPAAELPAGEWLSAPVRLADPDRRAAVRRATEAYRRLRADRTEAFLDWLSTASGAARPTPEQGAALWMTWDMVREMHRGGMTFGAHTVEHPVLTRCSPERQAREISVSVARIQDELSAPVTLFSYPIGSPDAFDDVTRGALRRAGITHAFSFYGGYHRPGSVDPLDIPRDYVSPARSPARFAAGVTLPNVFTAPAAGEPGGRRPWAQSSR